MDVTALACECIAGYTNQFSGSDLTKCIIDCGEDVNMVRISEHICQCEAGYQVSLDDINTCQIECTGAHLINSTLKTCDCEENYLILYE